MNIRTLKRIKFVLCKFYRDKICFLSFKILKYFKQYFSFIVDIYIYTMYHDHIHPNSSFLLPRDTCQHIPMSSFFSYYFYNHWVQAQSHACNMTSGSSQCSGLSCPDRSILDNPCHILWGPSSEMFSESWLSPRQSLNLSTTLTAAHVRRSFSSQAKQH